MNEAGSYQTNPTLLCYSDVIPFMTQQTLGRRGSSFYRARDLLFFQWVFCGCLFPFLCCSSLCQLSMRAFSGNNIFPIKLQTCTSCVPLAFLKQRVLRVRKLHKVTVIWITIVSYQRKQTWHFIYVKMSLYAPPTEQHTDLCPELSRSAAEGACTLALLSFDTLSCVQWVRVTEGLGHKHPHSCRWGSVLLSLFGKGCETLWSGDSSVTSDVCGKLPYGLLVVSQSGSHNTGWVKLLIYCFCAKKKKRKKKFHSAKRKEIYCQENTFQRFV